MINRKDIGKQGEKVACNYLIGENYRILEKNFGTKVGEVDIIAYKEGTIVFVEVKSRSNDKYGLPSEAVNYTKQKKIIRTAQYYISSKKLVNIQYRFDIIEIYIKSKKINHIENAFWI